MSNTERLELIDKIQRALDELLCSEKIPEAQKVAMIQCAISIIENENKQRRV